MLPSTALATYHRTPYQSLLGPGSEFMHLSEFTEVMRIVFPNPLYSLRCLSDECMYFLRRQPFGKFYQYELNKTKQKSMLMGKRLV